MFKTIIERFKKRRFKAWQIEITTRCPLRCVMCVRRSEEGFEEKDMKIEDFRKIVPYLKDVESVVLEGWGESLLHRDLIEIIGLVKGQGAEAGFVTSGFGLNRGYIEELRKVGLDFIGFSLSGATSRTHNSIRINSDFEGLLESMRYMGKMGDPKPKIHITYLLLKENIEELPLLLDIAFEIGIRQVVLINLIQVSNKRQDEIRAFTLEEKSPYEEMMDGVKKKSKDLGIEIFVPRLTPSSVSVCSENPLTNLYISVEGEVSPCVYLYPPVSSPFKRYFSGEEKTVQKVSFGNIFNTTFDEIWNGEAYSAFREVFMERRRASKRLYESILEMRRDMLLPYPDPPESCRTCYKMLGF
ncbi:MAG: SPASM domain-containing protein [Syntrophorhabdaceae bacterium]|nr:SPASM domain-containing protein [Syntrophorhabdaceae bacterium]